VLTWTIAVAIERSGGLSKVGSMLVWVQALVVVMAQVWVQFGCLNFRKRELV